MDKKVCERPGCGKKFTPKREHGKYCSEKCSNADRQRKWREKLMIDAGRKPPPEAAK